MTARRSLARRLRATRPLAFAALLCAPIGSGAAVASEGDGSRFKGWSGPKPTIDCRCRLPGEKVALGAVRCLTRGGERVTARCEKPVNLPYWRILREGCEESAPNS